MSWERLPFVDIDGKNWPVPFAAEMLGIPETDLRDLIRIIGIEPSGVIRMSDFRRSGRQPRAYPASSLIRVTEAVRSLSGDLGKENPAPG